MEACALSASRWVIGHKALQFHQQVPNDRLARLVELLCVVAFGMVALGAHVPKLLIQHLDQEANLRLVKLYLHAFLLSEGEVVSHSGRSRPSRWRGARGSGRRESAKEARRSRSFSSRLQAASSLSTPTPEQACSGHVVLLSSIM